MTVLPLRTHSSLPVEEEAWEEVDVDESRSEGSPIVAPRPIVDIYLQIKNIVAKTFKQPLKEFK